jgi:uncharacterized repeat protein (TIGR01451 family)
MLAIAVFATVLVVVGVAPGANAASITDPGGPLTRVEISEDLNCAVDYLGDAQPEFYGDTACGTFLATDGTLFGPTSIPAGGLASPRTGWTPVSQSQGGAGTGDDPFRITTEVDAGSTDVRIHQVDQYVVGQETYRTDITVRNNSDASLSGIIYKAADCYLQNSDVGYGAYDAATGAVSCTAGAEPGSRIEQFYPITGGSHYVESNYSDVWSLVGSQQQLPDECRQCTNAVDNGMGLSWAVDVAAGGSVTISHLTNFSPIGNVPLEATKTADEPRSAPGATNGYTITVSNPNTEDASLSSVSDELPNGFAYVPGSTTGATTTDPEITGSTLRWAGPLAVDGGASTSLSFDVTVSNVAGTYLNQASAIASGVFTVAPTGPTAPVVVEGDEPETRTLTVGITGNGSVSSNPAGISCPGTCVAAYSDAPPVALTATPGTGQTFVGWSGDCSGTGSCNVTMDVDHSVTATFAGEAPRGVRIEGHGTLRDAGHTRYVMDVHQPAGSAATGDFEFTSRNHRSRFEADEILAVSNSSRRVGQFTGTGSYNGHGGYGVWVKVHDNHDRPLVDRVFIEVTDTHGTIVFSTNPGHPLIKTHRPVCDGYVRIWLDGAAATPGVSATTNPGTACCPPALRATTNTPPPHCRR